MGFGDILGDGTPKRQPGVSAEELVNRFSYHAPKGDQVARYESIRDLAGLFASQIVRMTPASREQALALTNLEQAVFWANAAIARNE